jgi:mRNA-degrading endonuclease RelE of RelBE toxin-antitoxin system
MKTKVEIAEQVLRFVRALAPTPRRSLRLALRGLEEERGDIKQLEGELSGWCRLRVTSYRIIFRYEIEGTQRIARCVFAERRELVYELFTEAMSHLPQE